MKFRTTLILLGLVLGLLAFLILYTLRRPGAAEYEENSGLVFPPDEMGERLSQQVVRLDLLSKDKVASLSRPSPASQDWQMTQPIAAMADSETISAILATLETLKPLRTLSKKGGTEMPKQYMGQPEKRIRLTLANGRSAELALVATTADEKAVYAMRPDDPIPTIFILPRTIFDMTPIEVNDLREKRLLRFDPAKADHLTLQPEKLQLVNKSKGWEIVAPISDLANAAEVESLLRSLSARSLNKDSFSKFSPASCDLEKPAASVRIDADGKSVALRIAQDADGKWYGARDGDPGVIRIGAAAAEALRKTSETFRARRALPFSPDEATALTVSGSIPLKLERKDAGWQLVSSGKAADAERVRLFLRRLSELEVKERMDAPTPEQLAQDGLEPPRLALSIETPKGLWELRFGGSVPGGTLVYARRGSSGPILTVPDTIVEMLAEGEKPFAARIVALDLRNENISAIRIVSPERIVRLAREGKAWTLQEPAGTLDQDAVNALLLDLALVETFEALPMPQHLSDYGLDKPQLTVTISVEGPPAAERSLSIGSRRAEGGVYALNGDGGRVFVLDDSIPEILRRAFLKK